MADLATLGVVVTTKGVKEAERELNGLGKAGETAEKGVKRVGPSIDNAANAAKRGAADIERSAKRIGAALGAATLALATGVAFAVKSAIDRADEISKAAQKIGVTTEALSRLQFAAQLSDVSLEQLQQGIGFLGRELDKNEPLLNSLGVSVRDAAGNFLKADEVFRRVSDVFQKLPDGIEKGRLAAELFGARVGADLIPLLNQGSKAIGNLEGESDRLGNTISTELGVASEEFNDTLTRVKVSLNGVFNETAAKLLPSLQTLATRLNDPAFREGFATIITGATEAAIKVAGLIAELGNLAKFVGEELAARSGGAAGDDIVRLEQQAERIRERIKRLPSVVLIDLGGAKERRQKLEEELAFTERQIKQFYENAAKASADAPPIPVPEVEDVSGEDALKKLKEAFEAEAKAAEAAAAARKAAGDAARKAAQDERELARIQEELTTSIQRGAADLAGPAAQAARQYADELLELALIQERLAAANLLNADTERELAIAREQSAERYSRALKRIEDENPAKRVLADLEFELELLGKTNLERDKAIALRIANTDAASKEGQAIVAALEEIDRKGREIQALDEFRSSFEDAVASVLDGSKSIKDAFKDFADAIIAQLARIVAQNLTEQLFGGFGQQGGGSAGGFLSSLFGSFLGGGRAVGGPVRPGQLYPVAEKGQPELLSMYGRKYLIPGGEGEVMPLREGSGGGSTIVNQTIQVTGTVDSRSAYQLQREAKLRLDMAGGR